MPNGPVPRDCKCTSCDRGPEQGETFGKGPEDWDFIGKVCPDCWEQNTGEDDESEVKGEEASSDVGEEE